MTSTQDDIAALDRIACRVATTKDDALEQVRPVAAHVHSAASSPACFADPLCLHSEGRLRCHNRADSGWNRTDSCLCDAVHRNASHQMCTGLQALDSLALIVRAARR